MTGNGFEDLLLHNLPRDSGEAEQPVVPRILLALLADGRHLLLSSPQDSPQPHPSPPHSLKMIASSLS